MKRSYKTMSGITLLEIMLVLAIAGMVIAMSIRYFQSASASQRMATGMNNVQSVVGAFESYRLAGNPIDLAADATLAPYLPGSTMPLSPWTNAALSISAATSTNYEITIGTSGGSCAEFKKKLEANGPYFVDCGDPTAAVITVTTD